MRGKLAYAPLASFKSSDPLLCLFLQHLSRDSADAPELQVGMTWAWEAAAVVVAARVVAVDAAETSTQEVAAAQDTAVIHVKDACHTPKFQILECD
jgi:hypothetical protein